MEARKRTDIWTDNESLVKRMNKFQEYDPVAAYIKNDPDLYSGLRNAANKLNVIQYGHVRGHQDRCGRKLTFVEKMNIMADNLASKAVAKLEL